VDGCEIGDKVTTTAGITTQSTCTPLQATAQGIRLGVPIEIPQIATTAVLEYYAIQAGIVGGRGRGGGRRRLIIVVGDVLEPSLQQMILFRPLIGCEFIQLQNCFAGQVSTITCRF